MSVLEETRTETRSRVEERRARLTKLQDEPASSSFHRAARAVLTPDELRKAAEGYVEAATSR